MAGGGGARIQVIFDVTGYFVPDGSGARYVALTPARLLDTRTGNGLTGPFTAGTARTFTVADRTPGNPASNVPTTAIAVTGTLTVTGQSAGGWLSVTPTLDNSPPTSVLNFPAGDDRATGLTVQLGSGGILSVVFNGPSPGSTANVIFDVTGCFIP